MCPQVVPKFFVSGTFADIRNIRDRINEFFKRQTVIAVDLSGIEQRSREVKELIDRDLDTSDYYIGILGHRYGSRVDDINTAPSWTHYEYERFLKRYEGDKANLDIILLEPKKPGAMNDSCLSGALDVYEMLGLPEDERVRDIESQKFFKKVTKGGKIDPPDPDLIDLKNKFAPISLARASRQEAARFESLHDVDQALFDFLLGGIYVYKHSVEPTAKPMDAAPSMARTVTFPPDVVGRLSPKSLAPALCTVTARLEARHLEATDIAEALVSENLWEDVDRRVLDVAGISDPSVDQILKVMAQQEFGAEVASDRTAQIAAIAKEAATDPFQRTFHVKNLNDFGFAKIFLRDVWPALQKEIAKQAAPGSGLFLILSCDLNPETLLGFCQRPNAKKFDAAKPVLLTEDDLFPGAPAPESRTAKGTLS